MRYVNGFFCVVLTLFALVQYNDPDAVLWFLIYGVAAAWAGLVALRPDLLASHPRMIPAYALCLAAAFAGSLYMWPALPENWIHVEEEREGIGLIMVTVALIVVGWTWWRRSRELSPGRAAAE
ncbi:MAG TPA: transmembrane 220 family protein [Geminicoccaceae bacterium]|nr:transmembrane 220 family protein [Geminicoccaceae bacterium]